MGVKILYFGNEDSKLLIKIKNLIKGSKNEIIKSDEINLKSIRNSKFIMAIELNEIGINYSAYKFLEEARKEDKNFFLGSTAGFIVKSNNEYYTKKLSSSIIFLLNSMGCKIIGHSLVEGIEDFRNFDLWARVENKTNEEIFDIMIIKLINRIDKMEEINIKNPKILVLHAGDYKISNTLGLWNKIKKNIKSNNIKEFHVEEGKALDCYGCSYDTCMYYSEQKSCFYGGVITKELLPLIEEADIIIWICPNYNDAVSAKLMAVINRLTVLYKRVSFYNKRIFAVIVSGNSGSDSVASQIIGALNVNKGFQLPPYFCITEIASEVGSIHNVTDINKKAYNFSQIINLEIFKTTT